MKIWCVHMPQSGPSHGSRVALEMITTLAVIYGLPTEL